MNKFDQLYNLILEQKLSNTDETAIFKLLNKEIGNYLKRIKYQYGQALPNYQNRDQIKLLLSNDIKLKGTLGDLFNKVGITDKDEQETSISQFYSKGDEYIKKLKIRSPKFDMKSIQDVLTNISNDNDDYEFSISGKPTYSLGTGDDYPDQALNRTDLSLDTYVPIAVNIKSDSKTDPVAKFKKGDIVSYKSLGNEVYGEINSDPRYRIGLKNEKDYFEYIVTPIKKWGEPINIRDAYVKLEEPYYETKLHDPSKFSKSELAPDPSIKTIDSDSILKFIKKYKNWNVDSHDDTSVLISTKEHGNTYAEEPGQEDIDEAKLIIKELKNKFNDIKVEPEIVDEYVTLNILPK
jgi:hypothetical protein